MNAKGCCTEWEQEIILYLDNELSSDGCGRVEKHLKRCENCANFYYGAEREERLLAGALRQQAKTGYHTLAIADNVMDALPGFQPITLSRRSKDLGLFFSQFLMDQGRRHAAIAASILVCILGMYATLQMGYVTEEPFIHIERSGVLVSSPYRQPYFIVRPEGEFFEFPDGSVIYASPNTLFSVENYPEIEEKNSVGMERRIRLQSGELFIDVQPREEGFTVVCPNGTAKVVGTQFYVNVTSGATKITTVAVREGIVLVETKGRNTRTAAGQMTRLWSMSNGKKISLQLPEPTRLDLKRRLDVFNQCIGDRSAQMLVPQRELYDLGHPLDLDTIVSPFLTDRE
ncbi:MAG: FecR domain-containing protein [Candidatus Omnitrophota bacterium]